MPAAETFFVGVFFLSNRAQRREPPMRTYFNVVVTNRNDFGFGQDRVVSSLNATCAHAAQHLALWHASKRARESARAMKRRGSGTAAMAGAVLWAKQICLAITGPTRLPVRRMSPVLVTA